MTNITKHNTKKERECYCRKERWVGFTVSSNTISLNNLLSRAIVRVDLEKSGLLLAPTGNVLDRDNMD